MCSQSLKLSIDHRDITLSRSRSTASLHGMRAHTVCFNDLLTFLLKLVTLGISGAHGRHAACRIPNVPRTNVPITRATVLQETNENQKHSFSFSRPTELAFAILTNLPIMSDLRSNFE